MQLRTIFLNSLINNREVRGEQMHKIKFKTAVYSSLVSLILLGVFLSVIFSAVNLFRQKEVIEATDKFITFENKVERLIYSKVTLLQGFEAYIEINPNLEEEEAYLYLENLLSENSNYIRNIGVIEDTTIIWIYPHEENQSAIGTDLALVDEQKDNILKVKNEDVNIFQGPVELVQGGKGFIVRLPIVREDGYWGQISIVLNSEEILRAIESYSKEADLNVEIYNQTDLETPFFLTKDSVGSVPIVFNVDPSFINWKVYVTPQSGWNDYTLVYVLFILLAVVISVFVGLVTYKGRKSQYQLKILSIQDSLTGLYNRRYLEDMLAEILNSVKKDSGKFGLVSLDLNSFKSINDNYGHQVGDMVLVETARLLKENAKKSETVFRTGGDEFLIVVSEIKDKKDLEKYKNKIKLLFINDFKVENFDMTVTPSIGFSIYPEDGEDIDILMHVADKEMYKEKPCRVDEKML